MTQVFSNRPYTVESSMNLSRPDHKTLQKSDANTEKTFITEYDDARRISQLRLPNSTGPRDYTIRCSDDNVATNAPIPSIVKKRHEDKILDPITGFISPSGEFYLQSNKTTLPSFGKAKLDPHNVVPQHIHSIRNYQEAIDELK